jgi:hypothetical protein
MERHTHDVVTHRVLRSACAKSIRSDLPDSPQTWFEAYGSTTICRERMDASLLICVLGAQPSHGWRSRRIRIPDLGSVGLIASDRQCGNALAHLAPGTFIAGVVDTAVDTGQAGLLA